MEVKFVNTVTISLKENFVVYTIYSKKRSMFEVPLYYIERTNTLNDCGTCVISEVTISDGWYCINGSKDRCTIALKHGSGIEVFYGWLTSYCNYINAEKQFVTANLRINEYHTKMKNCLPGSADYIGAQTVIDSYKLVIDAAKNIMAANGTKSIALN